ncbi:MAG TPA: SAM-dependent chlorinase/fluorinase [Candidatus Limnocylindrales bacterium]
MPRQFISFLTDFGPDAAAAICRGVMLSIAPDAQIVDISHSVETSRIRDGAFLLWMSRRWMPVGTHVAVVDPGVGTERRPIAIRTGRGDALIGPDNGLLRPAASSLGGIREARLLENPAWRLPHTSATFHGRDIFAPMAGHLAAGGAFADVGPALDPASLVALDFPEPTIRDGRLEVVVVYIDSFGNLRLSATPEDLRRALGVEPGDRVRVRLGTAATIEVEWARTFGAVAAGEALLYEDSNGSLALADSQGHIASRLGVAEDETVVFERA